MLVSDFDPVAGELIVTGKGRKQRRLPVRGPMLYELRLYLISDLPHVGRPPVGGDHLLYPVRRLSGGRGPEGQRIWRMVPEPAKRPSS